MIPSSIICNGYKDENYVELALLAQKMGRNIFLVVEKLNEKYVFGAGLQSYVELLAVAHYLLHHFAYLVHLDRVDD